VVYLLYRTGMENHAKYGGSIYFHNDRELYVSQFIASELTWKEKGLKVTQMTQYPDEQGTALEITADAPVRLTINIRYPSWAAEGIELAVNGRKVQIKNDPEALFPSPASGKTGIVFEVKILLSSALSQCPDDSLRVAVFLWSCCSCRRTWPR